MNFYKNGKPVALDDYVRVENSVKNFWGWIKSIREDGTLDILDKKGKTRQTRAEHCKLAVEGESSSNKKDLIERIIKITSEVAKSKKKRI